MLDESLSDLIKPLLVLIIDPSPMMREAIKLILNKISSTHITIESDDVELAEQKLQSRYYPNLIIYSLAHIDEMSIFNLGLLKAKYSNANLLITSALPKTVTSSFCASVNADNYLHHTSPLDSIYALLYPLLNYSRPTSPLRKQSFYLSKRHIQILKLIEQGLQNEEIAKFLQLEIGTIKTHLTRIYKILKVKNRSQAVFTAKQKGLL